MTKKPRAAQGERAAAQRGGDAVKVKRECNVLAKKEEEHLQAAAANWNKGKFGELLG